MVDDQAFKYLPRQNADHGHSDADGRSGNSEDDDVDRAEHAAEQMPRGLGKNDGLLRGLKNSISKNVSPVPTLKMLNAAHRSPTSAPSGPSRPASMDNPMPPAITSKNQNDVHNASSTFFQVQKITSDHH